MMIQLPFILKYGIIKKQPNFPMIFTSILHHLQVEIPLISEKLGCRRKYNR